MTEYLAKLLRTAVIAAIDGYRILISPIIGPVCRYHPTCSSYAKDAIEQHGVFTGGWLALRRIGRCHPWADGGLDPVPPAAKSSGPT